MAKQFLDEAGVTTLWTKCKNTFVKKAGDTMAGDLKNPYHGFYANLIEGSSTVKTADRWGEKNRYFKILNPIDASGGVPVYGYTIDTAGRYNTAGANSFFGVRENQIVLEVSHDNGTTWEAWTTGSGMSKAGFCTNVFCGNRTGVWLLQKAECSANALFRMTIASEAYDIPSGTAETDMLKYMVKSRIVSNTNRYMAINSCYAFVSTEQLKLQLTIQKAGINTTEGTEPTFTTVAVVNGVAGWAGGNSFKLASGIYFGGQDVNSHFIRFIFRPQAPDGSFDEATITSKASNMRLYDFCAFSDSIYTADVQYPECMYNSPLKVSDAKNHVYEFVGSYVPREDKKQSIGSSSKKLKEIYVGDLHADNIVLNNGSEFKYDISHLATFGPDIVGGNVKAFMRCSNDVLYFSISGYARYGGDSTADVGITPFVYFSLETDSAVADFLKKIGPRLLDADNNAYGEVGEHNYSPFGIGNVAFGYKQIDGSYRNNIVYASGTDDLQVFATFSRGGDASLKNEIRIYIEGNRGGITMNSGTKRDVSFKGSIVVPLAIAS